MKEQRNGKVESRSVVKLSDYNVHNLLPQRLQLRAPGFTAPEQLLEQHFTNEPDVYAVGVLTHLLLTGKLPFKVSENYVESLVTAQLMQQFAIKESSISPQAIDFIKQCCLPLQ